MKNPEPDAHSLVRPSVSAELSLADHRLGSRLLKSPVSSLMTREPIVANADDSLQQAARRMQDHRITCLPVVADRELIGLLTESMLARHVIAEQGDPSQAVAALMQTEPLVVQPEQPVFDVLALMTRHRIAHVPVISDGVLAGIVTQTDVIRRQTSSSVFMVEDIARVDAAARMAPITRHVPDLLRGLASAGASGDEVGRVTTSIAGTVNRRLIELAEQDLGPAPVPYAWMACGSQGRQEQTRVSDQDNCLVIDDAFDEAAHRPWFDAFARKVCEGLHAVGYELCKGNMMAMNPRWCQPERVWSEYVASWVQVRDTDARLAVSFVADARVIAGDQTLAARFRTQFVKTVQASRAMTRRLLEDALAQHPALTMFGRLALHRNQSGQAGLVDLKRGGVVPVVDLARVHALVNLDTRTNTLERLSSRRCGRGLSDEALEELTDALKTVTQLKVQCQAEPVSSTSGSGNEVSIDRMSALGRRQLVDAFSLVRSVQSAVQNRLSSSDF